MPLDSMLVSAAVIAVFGCLRSCSSGLIFKRGHRGSGWLCILKGAEAFEAAAEWQVDC